MTNKQTTNAWQVSLTPMEIDYLAYIARNGPLFDGDIPSKSCRDTLLRKGLISKIVVKKEQGYQACNYFGWEVLEHFQRKPHDH